MSTFGERIHAIRWQRSLTREQFAETIGVHWWNVASWELGRGYPIFCATARLADACGVTIEWFVDGRGEGPAIDPNMPLFRAVRRVRG